LSEKLTDISDDDRRKILADSESTEGMPEAQMQHIHKRWGDMSAEEIERCLWPRYGEIYKDSERNVFTHELRPDFVDRNPPLQRDAFDRILDIDNILCEVFRSYLHVDLSFEGENRYNASGRSIRVKIWNTTEWIPYSEYVNIMLEKVGNPQYVMEIPRLIDQPF
jgi:hypothetical protein